jgi:glycosyltransferase involved in cell wall biosynthesis
LSTAPRRRRYDVAIYAPFAGHLYSESTTKTSGGAETQMRELARALTERGLRVCHVVFDYGGIPGSRDGIDLVTQPPEEFRRHMVVYSRSIFRALSRADAEVYVQRTAGFETGVVAGFARLHRRRFVFSGSSSADFERRPPLPTPASRAAFSLGLRSADLLVAQTQDQVDLAGASLGRRARLIRSFCATAPRPAQDAEAFLWIGGLIDYKGPLEYVRLAERLPEARFWMVGTPRGPEWSWIEEEVGAAARRLPNFEIIPQRSRDELMELYPRAVAVVNTSQFEGFPNTFMEGWSCGVPALSLRVDPDGLIERHRLGAVADGSVDGLVDAARGLWEARADRSSLSQRVTRYIEEQHSPRHVGEQWAELVDELAAGRRRE